jgi:hypothetical protein
MCFVDRRARDMRAWLPARVFVLLALTLKYAKRHDPLTSLPLNK